jgi:uncharacterized damage-inducible protein DinB
MEPKHISDQIRRSVNGEAWYGPALLDALSGIDAATAKARPIAAAHNIREIVLHVTAWQRIALQGLNGIPVELAGDADWPASNETWSETIESLKRSEAELSARVGELSDEQLEQNVTHSEGRRYPMYVLLHGIAQHNAYHAGQIALLKIAAR